MPEKKPGELPEYQLNLKGDYKLISPDWHDPSYWENFPTARKIKESGIFWGKNLKGRKYPSFFKIFPITDPELFVLKIARAIDFWVAYLTMKEKISADFDGVLAALNQIINNYKQILGKRLKNRLETAMQDITDIKTKALDRPIPKPRYDLVDALIVLFEENVPDAPADTVAKKINQLLELFKETLNIDLEADSIKQRMYRKKQLKQQLI